MPPTPMNLKVLLPFQIFAEKTGVDALAIAIGTSHGAYKFTKKPDGSVLKMDVLIAIHKRLPHTHLVMHGSSSVPKDLQDEINKYGGSHCQGLRR